MLCKNIKYSISISQLYLSTVLEETLAYQVTFHHRPTQWASLWGQCTLHNLSPRCAGVSPLLQNSNLALGDQNKTIFRDKQLTEEWIPCASPPPHLLYIRQCHNCKDTLSFSLLQSGHLMVRWFHLAACAGMCLYYCTYIVCKLVWSWHVVIVKF